MHDPLLIASLVALAVGTLGVVVFWPRNGGDDRHTD